MAACGPEAHFRAAVSQSVASHRWRGYSSSINVTVNAIQVAEQTLQMSRVVVAVALSPLKEYNVNSPDQRVLWTQGLNCQGHIPL